LEKLDHGRTDRAETDLHAVIRKMESELEIQRSNLNLRKEAGKEDNKIAEPKGKTREVTPEIGAAGDTDDAARKAWPAEWPVYWEGGDPTGLGRERVAR
jgi:hypothetical protein